MKIKDWKKFQHFKDRRPPWIKLYRDLLDDDEYYSLSPGAAKTLMLLWLLASEDETGVGMLPSVKKVAFRLRMQEKLVISHISELQHFLIQDDIKTISERYQVGLSETETKVELETKTETEVIAVQVMKPSPPTSDEDWMNSLRNKEAYQGVDLDRELGKCKTWCETNRKLFSRRRFVNWINRAERPIQAHVDSPFMRGMKDFLSRHEEETL